MTGADPPVIALVGCGAWGRHILRDLRTLGCAVPVVARSEASRARAVEGGAATIVPSVVDLPQVDAAVVASTTSTHADVLEQILVRGIPVFVEKPLSDDLMRARALAAAYPDTLFVMDKWRYHPGVGELARMTQAGALGEPVGIAARRVAWGNPHLDVDPLWTYLPHDLSIAIEILGALPPLRTVSAEVVGGEIAGAVTVLGERPWVTIETSICAPAARRELRVVGTEGCAVLDGGYAEELLVSRNGMPAGEPERVPFTGELPLLAELRAFVAHVQGEAPPPASSAADGLAVVEMINAIHDAIGTAGH